MPYAPYIVSGTVYTLRGTLPNSLVTVNSELRTSTNSLGQFLFDLAELASGYTDAQVFTITANDVLNNEFVSDTITVSGGSLTKNIYTDSRSEQNSLTHTSEISKVELRRPGNKPVTVQNMLPVQTQERKLKQKLSYVSGTSQVEYVCEAPPGTLTNAARWRIQKIVYSGTDVTDILWANGNAEFDKICDSKATYSYS